MCGFLLPNFHHTSLSFVWLASCEVRANFHPIKTTCHIIIKIFLICKSPFITYNSIMHQVLLYFSLFCSILALIMCYYACTRVGQFISATKNLDWDDIANITGDLATTKKTIQTLNNRLNGMHSPKIAEQELMLQLLKNPPNQMQNGKINNNVGG